MSIFLLCEKSLFEKLNKEWLDQKEIISKKNPKIDAVKAIINQQTKAIGKLEEQAKEHQKKAEYLYTHYQVVKELLEHAAKDLKAVENNPLVIRIDHKKKTLTINIEDEM